MKRYCVILLSLVFLILKSQVNCIPQFYEGDYILGENEYVCDPTDPITLNIDITNVKSTSSYVVESISYDPPVSFITPLANPVIVNQDDEWSGVVKFEGPRDINNDGEIGPNEQKVPYNFCFFGNIYTQAIIGTNGIISFDTSDANGYNEWEIPPGATLPSRNDGDWNDGNIFGACHDMDFGVNYQQSYLTWEIFGEYPCRYLVVMYRKVPQYNCNNLISTQMIVLYENTNIIEVFIENKPRCLSWNPDTNGGIAVIGIQNDAGTVAYTPPGRNNYRAHTTQEAWRFAPNGNYTPQIQWSQSINGGPFNDIGGTLSNQFIVDQPMDVQVEVTYNTCDEEFVVGDLVHLEPIEIGLPEEIDAGCIEGIYPISVNDYDGAEYQWFYNGNPVSGQNSSSINAYDPGTYAVEVNYESGLRSCDFFAETDLEIYHPPIANDVQDTICDIDNSGSNVIDLTQYESQINNTGNVTFSYHSSFADANSSHINSINPYNYNAIQGNNTIYVRVQEVGICFNIVELNIFIKTLADAGEDGSTIVCANIGAFDLRDLLQGTPDDDGIWIPALNSGTNLYDPAIDGGGEFTYFINGFPCPDDSAKVTVEVNEKPFSTSLVDASICALNDEATLNAGPGFDAYQWYEEGVLIPGATGPSFTSDHAGDFAVELTINYSNGVSCSALQEARIILSDTPYIGDVIYRNGSVELVGAGSTPPYRFNVNGGEYLDQNVFSLPPGTYEFGIISSTNCEGFPQEITVLSFTNIITPNGDGINDEWNISSLETLKNPSLKIYDRYGKVLSDQDLSKVSVFKWDGKYQGRALPTTSYWYEIRFEDFNDKKVKFNGYLVVKNRN